MNHNQHLSILVQKSFRVNIALLTLLLIFPVQNAFAVTCHCFKERSFKPSQPASADPYILATARNSLVAAASGIDKGAVVRLRMKGTTETDLWLSSYLATRVRNKTADQLLDARDNSPDWAAALDAIKLDTGILGEAFKKARSSGDAEGMARALADPVLGKTFDAGDTILLQLRRRDANIAESAVSLYLAARLKRTPEDVLNEVRKGKQTWGSLFNSLGTRIDTVGDLIAAEVKRKN